MDMHKVALKDETETLALGETLAGLLRPGDFIALTGDLGAGKTTLARGLITAKTGQADVPSPTYTLVQTYEAPDMEIWHCDLYRLERPEDAFELGLIDVIGEITCLVEWPERMGDLLPKERLTIDLNFTEIGRTATLKGTDVWMERIKQL